MRFGELRAAAEQARHLEVPASQRAVGGAVEKPRVQTEDRVELRLDRFSVFESLPKTERFGKRAHVGRDPEVSFRPVRLYGDGLSPGLDAVLEKRAPFAVGC